MELKYPDKTDKRFTFSEKNFEKGFKMLDVNKDGKLDLEDIKIIVEKKVKRENLYVK